MLHGFLPRMHGIPIDCRPRPPELSANRAFGTLRNGLLHDKCWPLAKRLLILAFVAYLPALAILTYNEFDLRRAREAEVRKIVLRNAEQALSELDRIFEGVENLLRAVGEVPAVRDFDTEGCGAYLQSLRARVPYLKSLSVLDIAGRVQCQNWFPRDEQRYHTRTYFRSALASRRFVVGSYAVLRAKEDGVLPLAMPLFRPSGSFYGVVVAALDLQWLETRLAERGVGAGSALTVADRDGTVVFQGAASGPRAGARVRDEVGRFVHAEEAGVQEVALDNGQRRIVAYLPPAATGTVFVSADLARNEAFADINRATTRGFAVLLLGLVAALIGAWAAGRLFIQRPIKRLLTTIGAYRAGNRAARTAMSPAKGEIETVGAAFDHLLDEVASHQVGAAREAKARAESEKRYRSLIELSPDAEFVDIDSKIVYANAAMRRLLGASRADDIIGRSSLDFIAPEFRDAVRARIAALKETGEANPPMEQRWMRLDGSFVAVEVVSAPVPWEGTQGNQVILRDITARKQAEETQQILVHELNHRVKNTLATVQSLAHQTLRTASSLTDFGQAFGARLASLSATQNLLTQGSWEHASLTQLLKNELNHYGEERFRLEGEDILLPPRFATPLGMIFHELATNAAKYGALSSASGRVRVGWSLDGDGFLALDWREQHGPVVVEPSRKGFGSTLIERITAGELGGTYSRAFDPEGFQSQLCFPLPSAADAISRLQKAWNAPPMHSG